MTAKIHHLTWTHKTPAHLVSGCGRFSINVCGPVGDTTDVDSTYGFTTLVQSAVTIVGFYPWACIGVYPTIDHAIAACEDHASGVLRDFP